MSKNVIRDNVITTTRDGQAIEGAICDRIVVRHNDVTIRNCTTNPA